MLRAIYEYCKMQNPLSFKLFLDFFFFNFQFKIEQIISSHLKFYVKTDILDVEKAFNINICANCLTNMTIVIAP